MTGDILDLIDSAVRDWETSDDAMRWMPDVPKPAKSPGVEFSLPRLWVNDVEVPVTSLEWQQPRLSLGTLGFAADFERQMAALSQDERNEFVAYWRAGPLSFEQAFYAWRMRRMMEPIRVSLSAWADQLTAALRSAQGSIGMFSRALRLEPWHGPDAGQP